MTETRKLAAILAADVVGFSRLAGTDEDRILARLRTLRSDMIDPTISVHEDWLHVGMTNRKILPGRGSVASPMPGSQGVARIAMRQSINRLASVASSSSSLAQRRHMTLGETAIQSRHG
jgi:class 3 adenylate cyclase